MSLRTIKLYGFFGDCPDKNICNNVFISLYQENDAQINVHLVSYELETISDMPAINDFSFTVYTLAGSVVFARTLSHDDVTVSDNVISIRLYDDDISELSGYYYVECNAHISDYRFTLFIGHILFCETNLSIG